MKWPLSMQKIRIPRHQEEEEGVEVVVEGSEEAIQIEVVDHLQHVALHSEGLTLVNVVLPEGRLINLCPDFWMGKEKWQQKVIAYRKVFCCWLVENRFGEFEDLRSDSS